MHRLSAPGSTCSNGACRSWTPPSPPRVITFGGLLAAADPGDGDVAWLAPLQQRYRAVMVDEFQDTDPVQWRLLQRLVVVNVICC